MLQDNVAESIKLSAYVLGIHFSISHEWNHCSWCWTKHEPTLHFLWSWTCVSLKKSKVVEIKLENNTMLDWYGSVGNLFVLLSIQNQRISNMYVYIDTLSRANLIKHKSIVIVLQTFDIICLNAFWNLPLNFIDHVENKILSIERILSNPKQSYVFAIYKSNRITVLICITKAIHVFKQQCWHIEWTLKILQNAHVFVGWSQEHNSKLERNRYQVEKENKRVELA